MNKDGFSSIQTLLIILFLSILILETGTEISLTINHLDKNSSRLEEKRIIQDEVHEIVNQLSKDPTPDSDSPFDPVWFYIREKSSGYVKLQLSDASSRVNVNSVHPLFLKRTEFRNTLKEGVSIDVFRKLRETDGFFIDLSESCSSIFKKGIIEKYLTPYGFMNVNTAYEYSLQKMFGLLTGDFAAAEVFHTFVSEALRNGRTVSEDELSSAFGTCYTSFHPVIGTYPEMNVNFVPGFILKQILSYPYGGKAIENSGTTFQRIISIRRGGEINRAELHSLIKTKTAPQERVFQYLGTKTWFWKLDLETNRNTARAVIICIPEKNDYRIYSFTMDPI